ncbi:MAG: pyruvate dehydrogenase (acetyl-transferring) E1 component subunit alpha [Chloroflexi bacterium]|nr:pyruvate dehydrogenase (acetyl-transferring) E1 component subunit alpha [Chloroflexota bacterium]
MATNTLSIDKEKLLDWYHQIVLIRKFETVSDELYKEKKITGVYLHLYNGQEATGVGAIAALRDEDSVITAYRDHGIAIARGVDPKVVMAEMMGKRTGTSGGKGGSMHIASREHNFWGGYAIVAGHLPLAAGIALKESYTDSGNVVLCFMGDGSTNNGYFHESLNLSAVWNLPVVWLIESNGVGMGTRVEDSSGQTDLVKRAIAYGMKEGPRVDGQNVIDVYNAVSEAVEYARTNGPILMESLTYRYKGHGVSDKQYDVREGFKQELDEWHEKDPITVLRKTLTENFKGIDKELERIDEEADKIVAEAVEYGENSPAPTYEDLMSNIYV